MHTDRSPLFCAACLTAALLTACDRTAPEPPSGPTSGAPSGPAEYPLTSPPAPPATVPDPMPPASAVMPPNAGRTLPGQSTTDGTRKPYQASPGVLVPGQNNDHSAPISPGR